MVAVVTFAFMIVVSHEPSALEYLDQGIFVAVRGIGRLWNLVGFHLHDPSTFIYVLGVEDEPSLRHGVFDTISRPSVKGCGGRCRVGGAVG